MRKILKHFLDPIQFQIKVYSVEALKGDFSSRQHRFRHCVFLFFVKIPMPPIQPSSRDFQQVATDDSDSGGCERRRRHPSIKLNSSERFSSFVVPWSLAKVVAKARALWCEWQQRALISSIMLEWMQRRRVFPHSDVPSSPVGVVATARSKTGDSDSEFHSIFFGNSPPAQF